MSNSVFNLNEAVKPYFALVIFIVSLFLICVKIKNINIGRAGYSLIGATLMVMFGIVPPKEIGSVVNWDTIILLMSMMMLSNYMEKANIWGLASNVLLYKCKTPFVFLIRVCIISAVMSSVLTNDTVCVTLTPIVIKACETTSLPYFPYLMAVATSANIGSASLPVGNPQNMIIATAGGLEFLNFFKVSVVSSFLGVLLNSVLLYFYFKKNLSKFEITVDLTKQISLKSLTKNNSRNEKEIKQENSLNYNKLTQENSIQNNDSINNNNTNSNNNNNDNSEDIITGSYNIDNNSSNIIIISTPTLYSEDNEDRLLDVDINDQNSSNNNNDGKFNQYNKNNFFENLKNPKFYLEILKKLIEIRVSIILFLILVGFFVGLHMGFTVLFGVSILMMIEHNNDIGEIIKSVDWELLLFFSGLFVLVDGFDRQFAKEAWTVLEPFVPLDDKNINIFKVFIFSIMVLVLSNVLGNVPLVLSLSPRLLDANVPNFTWLLLAFVSTVAGNLTLVGSVANLIVAEKAKAHHVIGFLEYLKFGVPSTILVVLIGVPIVVLMSSI
ncbi:hypothetical protein DICPUDRAFT_76346 [Dictyostelium purpureum]|uniref:Citrate transporter-like domain-containing protein n=1 Tax=Dictyostelium purpureum TaxID=5786 RepID=F0ZDC1_DICPU|nr:uncharacterized protein DICPUDRAFT_76346 [Dictyostelium purpureum]EGC38084.1 hypothetical protein DICPUDRAFT_76346 [Dictyostelium purpureum]|eukprot:XP_003285391.1 hypothetical protein DICPUDRAFT_76346 [Dictyostelium purpureum]